MGVRAGVWVWARVRVVGGRVRVVCPREHRLVALPHLVRVRVRVRVRARVRVS